MRTLLLAGAAALSLTAFPVALNAQATTSSADKANAEAQPAPSTTTVIVDTNPATPDVIVIDKPGNLTPPPVASLNKTYPVCTRQLQDNCQNAGEGGAPGRSRALGYWPGEPASERDRTDVGG